MRSNDIPDRPERGLSTEDLAQPAEERSADLTEETPSGVPTYPGESTAPLEETEETEETEGTTEPEPAEEAGDTTEEAGDTTEEDLPRLLPEEDEQGYRERWEEVQSRFVDDPREAVHAADTLVAEVMQTLAATFAEHKQDLEGQWSQGEQVDTEDLRKALRRYRSFFNRLLST
ncbi:hypothetical protein AB0K09_27675 [Streptomyces sp. NPDC049577]|uniref:hypothetical protein n=1 Tax=Streptomyces sp. NPDC049577 TaxID=3155153 RepID=UPI003448CF81